MGFLIIGGKFMEYKQNFHVLLPIEKFKELKEVSKALDVPRAKIVREALDVVLRKYKRKNNMEAKNK